MRLPAELLDAIQRETDKVDRRKLAQATAQLTEHYKAADFSSPAVATEAHRAAYLAVRLPATYAAIRRVFAEINCALRKPRSPACSISAPVLVQRCLPPRKNSLHLQQATLLESDAGWIALGNVWRSKARFPVSAKAQWLKAGPALRLVL